MIHYSVISKLGNRDINEDSYSCACVDNNACFVVADGLGGHAKGEVASALVVDEIQQHLKQCEVLPDEALKDAIVHAQDALMAKQRELCVRNDMKTTVVVLYITGEQLIWGHVGDSRLYAFKKNKIIEQTKDHSIPQMLVLSGDIPAKKIRNHPQRNLLLRVMGIEWDSPKCELSTVFKQDEFEAFLLCSDGFWELITEKDMCKTLKRSKSPEEWLQNMVSIVERNGANKEMDNYTAVTIFC